MEKADNVFMMCADFGWADLGSWGALYDIAGKDGQKNANLKRSRIMLYESSGNIIAMDGAPEKLTVVQGLNDYIIAESNNVLLICRKDDEQRIKQFVTDAQLNFGEKFN
jgi:mannose-1-phosphate guanylyltransferase